MRHAVGWAPWEIHVNEQLGLDPTVASGNQFHDKGDGVDRGNGDWAFMVDAKYTNKNSFSLRVREMAKYVTQARITGKRFALAVRIWPPGYQQPADYAVIPFDDFAALVARLKEAEAEHA